MRNLITLLFLAAISMTACKTKDIPVEVPATNSFFGEKISAQGAMTYDQLLTKLDKQESIESVKVRGTIDGVCQKKGCWMNIVSDTNPEAKSMFVKFKDYAFFMPLDASGSTAILKGRAYKEETSVDELRHYAEDEGQSAEEIAKITEPKVELKFMASGVIIE